MVRVWNYKIVTFISLAANLTTPFPFVKNPNATHPDHGTDHSPNATYLPALENYLYHGPDGDGAYYYDSSVRPNMFNKMTIEVEYYLMGINNVVRRCNVHILYNQMFRIK